MVDSFVHFFACSKSVKNRRKASHRKWSLRAGSFHEDLALMEAITDVCGTVDSLQGVSPVWEEESVKII